MVIQLSPKYNHGGIQIQCPGCGVKFHKDEYQAHMIEDFELLRVLHTRQSMMNLMFTKYLGLQLLLIILVFATNNAIPQPWKVLNIGHEGIAKINNLLKHSRHIFSDGLNDVFVKPGSYNQAVKDFYALNPLKVKDTKKYGKARVEGYLGLRKITVQETDAAPTLSITQFPERNAIRVDPVIDKTIVYIDKTGP